MGLVIVGPFEYEYRLAPEYEYDSRPKPRNQYRIITPFGFSPKPALAQGIVFPAAVVPPPPATTGKGHSWSFVSYSVPRVTRQLGGASGPTSYNWPCADTSLSNESIN